MGPTPYSEFFKKTSIGNHSMYLLFQTLCLIRNIFNMMSLNIFIYSMWDLEPNLYFNFSWYIYRMLCPCGHDQFNLELCWNVAWWLELMWGKYYILSLSIIFKLKLAFGLAVVFLIFFELMVVKERKRTILVFSLRSWWFFLSH